MAGPSRLLLAGLTTGALLVLTPLAVGAQTGVPITFKLTVAGPTSGADGFDVHIDLPVTPQARVLCSPAGTAASSVPVCASGQTYTVVYEATEWPNVPYWFERVHNGSVVQTFSKGSVSAERAVTVSSTFTYAGGVPVPETGSAAGSPGPLPLLLVGLGALLTVAAVSVRPAALVLVRRWRR